MTSEACPASILVVEDDDDIRDSIGVILEDEGYCVALAEDGQTALDLLEDLPRPCLLLVDLVMPRLDGWTLMKVLSKDDRLATIPVVVLSAAHDPKVTGQRFVKKPIELGLLLRIVQEHCCGERGTGGGSKDREPATTNGD
jgi:CheY-like chemotaxis protein